MCSSRPRTTTPRHANGGRTQILCDLGVTSIRNLATSARSYVGLSGFAIELLGEEPLGES